jgi:hypothetical protein
LGGEHRIAADGERGGLRVTRDDRFDFPGRLKRDYPAGNGLAGIAKGCIYPGVFEPSNDRFVDTHRLFSRRAADQPSL